MLNYQSYQKYQNKIRMHVKRSSLENFFFLLALTPGQHPTTSDCCVTQRKQ